MSGGSSGRLYTKATATLYSEATWAESALTSAGRDLLDDANAAAQAVTLGLEIGVDVQAQGDVLDDLNTLGVVGADSEFLVATGAGAFAWEKNAVARMSLGLGLTHLEMFS